MAQYRYLQVDTQSGSFPEATRASTPPEIISGQWSIHYIPRDSSADAVSASADLTLLSIDMGVSGIALFKLVPGTTDVQLVVEVDGTTVLDSGEVLSWAARQGAGGDSGGIQFTVDALGGEVTVAGAKAGDGTYAGIPWAHMMADGVMTVGCAHDGLGGYEHPCEGYVSEPYPAAAYLEPLDRITATSVVGAYSVARRLRSAYTGAAFRVRRASDDAESDIGFTTAGGLDVGALLAFVGASSGYVVTLYDQSGGGKDLVQATAAQQPQIVNAGALVLADNRPAMLFDGVDDDIARGDALGISGNPGLDCFVVWSRSTGGVNKFPLSLGGDSFGTAESLEPYSPSGDDTSLRLAALPGSRNFDNAPDMTTHRSCHIRAAAGETVGDMGLWIGDVSQTETSATNPSTVPALQNERFGIGSRSSGVTFMAGHVSEAIVASAAVGNALSAADASVLRAELAAWWGA